MKTSTLIIGGGLSGLSLAYRLQNAGHDYKLVEARKRFGGRIKSLHVRGDAIDLGPSWFWPGQVRIASLLDEVGLGFFEQWGDGAQLYEQPDGQVLKNSGFMSMAGSYRINGGTAALTDTLVAQLDPARIHTASPVLTLDDTPVATLASGQEIAADRIVLALPPRLAAKISFQPELPPSLRDALEATPTWMGAHAKFVAVYERPFWRDGMLSGDASSRRGPMVEIHDASPQSGRIGALFGFVGLAAAQRAQVGDALIQAAIGQLVNLFGSQAAEPIATQLEDWSTARYTSTTADAVPPAGHPPYLMPPAAQDVWGGKLIFATTEMTTDNGGLIEGTLAASEYAASKILSA